jgi:hypothetical protein
MHCRKLKMTMFKSYFGIVKMIRFYTGRDRTTV